MGEAASMLGGGVTQWQDGGGEQACCTKWIPKSAQSPNHGLAPRDLRFAMCAMALRWNVQKGMGDVMVGEMMETEARAILDKGISQGVSQGITQGEDRMRKGMVLAMLREGDLPVERIAMYSGLSVAEIQKLASQSEEP